MSVHRILVVAAATLACSLPANADFLKKVGNAIGGGAKAIGNAAVAPTKTIINAAGTLTGKNSTKDIFRPFKQAAGSLGSATAQTTDLLTKPNQFFIAKAKEIGKKVGGEPGHFAVDLLTIQQGYSAALLQSGGHATANILQGRNPLEIWAAPLAGAIRAARESHYGSSQPLPEDVKQGLKGVLPDWVLKTARWTVGTVEITLPNFIGKGAKFMEGDYAVVVDEVIVFKRQPPSFAKSPAWWGHEVYHVQQYEQWGIEGFAYRYLKTMGKEVEDEAIAAGNRSLSKSSSGVGGAKSLSGKAHDSHGTHTGKVSAASAQQTSQFVAMVALRRPPVGQIGPITMDILVTPDSRLIIVDNWTGRSMQVGWAMPARPGVIGSMWTLSLGPNMNFDVLSDGRVTEPIPPAFPGAGTDFGVAGRVWQL